MLNIKKCKSIVNNRKQEDQLTLAGHGLEETAEYSCLGTSVTASNKKFSSHEKFSSGKMLGAVGAVDGLMKNG